MSRTRTIFEATDRVLDTLRNIEEESSLETRKRIFAARRALQEAQNDYIKQGDRIKVTRKFVIHCTECGDMQMREEDYYLHLRQKHKYPDEDAASESNNPRIGYEQGLQQLKELLAQYTETLLEE